MSPSPRQKMPSKTYEIKKELTVRNLEVQGAVVKDLWETALPSARDIGSNTSP